MCALVCPDSAEIILLKYLLNLASPGNTVYHLYGNDLTPSESTPNVGVPGGPTESIEAGYAPITFTASNWTVTQASGITTGQYPGVTFSFTTGASPYGYYVTNTLGELMWLERFSGAPYSLPPGGGDIAITPKITLD